VDTKSFPPRLKGNTDEGFWKLEKGKEKMALLILIKVRICDLVIGRSVRFVRPRLLLRFIDFKENNLVKEPQQLKLFY